jgi:hypothetical protein
MEYHPREPRTGSSKNLLRRNVVVSGGVAIILVIGLVAFDWLSHTRPAIGAEISIAELSDFDFDQTQGAASDIPEKFRMLDGKRVTLVGNMWSPCYRDDGVDRFILCNIHRSEHKPPVAQEFVPCRMKSPTQCFEGQVSASGTLHIKIVHDTATAAIRSVFSLDVDDLKTIHGGEIPLQVNAAKDWIMP